MWSCSVPGITPTWPSRESSVQREDARPVAWPRDRYPDESVLRVEVHDHHGRGGLPTETPTPKGENARHVTLTVDGDSTAYGSAGL
jgi:hypothetical protein